MKNNRSSFMMKLLILQHLTLYFAPYVNAQTTPNTNLFQWKFSDNVSTSAVELHLILQTPTCIFPCFS